MATYATRQARQWSHDGMSEEDRRAYHRLYDRRRRAAAVDLGRHERMTLALVQIVTSAFPEVFANPHPKRIARAVRRTREAA